jgi:hypothetical protein
MAGTTMQTIEFDTYGPFQLPRVNGGIDRTKQKLFWDSIERSYPGLPGAAGCYIFAIRAGHGFTPWYVGKTEKRSFTGETWQPHKLVYYGDVTHNYKRGKPVLFLMAKLTTGRGKFAKPTKNKFGSVTSLELMVIQACLQKNDKLLNQRETKYLRRLQVPGYLNDRAGALTKAAKSLSLLLKS